MKLLSLLMMMVLVVVVFTTMEGMIVTPKTIAPKPGNGFEARGWGPGIGHFLCEAPL